MHVHFVGVGGKGVSQVLNFFVRLKKHYPHIKLTASDINPNIRNKLQTLVSQNIIDLYIPHTDKPITSKTDFLIVSPSVLKFDNPEVKKARNLNIPVIEFSDFMRFLRDEYLEKNSLVDLEYWDITFYKKIITKWYDYKFKKEYILKSIKAAKLFPFYFFNFSDLILIGVTGTDGKTTTSSMLFYLFKSIGIKVAMITTVEAKIYIGNNKFLRADTGLHQTTPPAVEILKYIKKAQKYGVKVVILEVTSHSLVQLRIAGIKFDYVLFTNITREHLDYHKNWNKYAYAKLLMISKHLKKDGIALLNFDDSGTRRALKMLKNKSKYNIKWYGADSNNILQHNWACIFRDIKLKQSKQLPAYTADFILNCNKQKIFVNDMLFNLFGKYNLYNFSLALYAFCSTLQNIYSKLELAKIIKRIKDTFYKFKLPTGRMQILHEKPLVIVDFAHTPNGLENALATVYSIKKQNQGYNKSKIFLIFGVAGERDKFKRKEMGKVAIKYADFIFLTAEDPRREKLLDINNQVIDGIKSNLRVSNISFSKIYFNRKFLKEADLLKERLDAKKLDYYNKMLDEIKDKILKIVTSKIEIYFIPKLKKFVFNFYEDSINSRKGALQLALNLANKQDIVIATGKAHEQSLAFGLKEYKWNDIKELNALLKMRFVKK